MTVPLLHIVGYSGSGKTTLMEKLIPALKAQGLRVATLKHSHHALEMDQRGKDSWRHKHAGAETSALVGAGQWMMVCDVEEDFHPQRWANQYAQGHDLVLVEGYHDMEGVKIEVMRQVCSTILRCEPATILAVVTDIEPFHLAIKHVSLNDTPSVCRVILNWLEQGK